MWGRKSKKSFEKQVAEYIAIMNWRNPNERDCVDSEYHKVLAVWKEERLAALAKFPYNVRERAIQIMMNSS